VKAILFGATGMIGQGVLRECLLDARIERVLAIGRNSCGKQHAKLAEIVHADLFELSDLAAQLSGYDACFFCLGVSSAGMSEADYTRITFDLPLAVARALLGLNPQLSFGFISGAGADSSERGRTMWARVKGRAENALLALSPRATVFRPGIIQPLHGITSRTFAYRALYTAMAPLLPALRALAPGQVTTTELLARALIEAAANGAQKRVLESRDINALAQRR
jgi:uncharacterized protein YbjT (DUF2867 family)